MSFASLPPTGLQTSVTVIDPPKPLPAFLTGSDGHEPPSAPHLAQSAAPSRVPYPSAAHASLPPSTTPSQNAPVKTPLTGQVSNATAKAAKTKRTFKVIIVGDAGVGKTCLSFRFCCGRFPAHTEATIGVDFRERSVMIEKELLRIQLWDTAGQERYRQSIVAHYYRNVNAVVFVYDVSSPKSFASLGSWIAECEKHGLTGSAEVPRILVGNKCDLQGAGERVNTDTAQMFADRHNMALFETSAKEESEADHVESIFMTLVHKLQQSKPMHVQSEGERKCKEQETLLLKAGDANQLEDDGWCC